jgi:hypothetical protein
MPDGMLAVTYALHGDLDRVRIPAPKSPRIGHELWQHTCCEIFIKAHTIDSSSGVTAYHEFNFAPSGEWAAFEFERYREGTSLTNEALDPQVIVRSGAGKLELDASIRLDRLSPAHSKALLSLALSAVVEELDGSLSYWALKHPAGKPDFHHPDAFALELSKVS